MSERINDGGPAFPQADSFAASEIAQVAIAGMKRGDERDATYLRVKAEALRGMSLRDYVAVQALNGLISNGDVLDGDERPTVAWAFRFADEFLKQRSKTP